MNEATKQGPCRINKHSHQDRDNFTRTNYVKVKLGKISYALKLPIEGGEMVNFSLVDQRIRKDLKLLPGKCFPNASLTSSHGCSCSTNFRKRLSSFSKYSWALRDEG